MLYYEINTGKKGIFLIMNKEKKLNEEQLLNFMIINIEHARHVENERLTFNSIYIAIIAGFFAFAFNKTPIISVISAFLLLIVSMIGLLFTKRWSDVFDCHMEKAKEIALLVYGDEDSNEYEHICNKYYYFKHDYRYYATMRRLNKLKQNNPKITYEESAAGINFKSLRHSLCQIRTKNLFYIFYIIVICALTALLIYNIINLF